ncbi:MAG: phosphate uptake regulator PhoU [Methanocalculaceae archaeon]|jgi:phosphate uptake regulator|nr:phosphate uptake regulator PhoU [Methanocalculaceae archaeon]
MDVRKVQVTGGSSFVISLPKDWIRQQKIEKNDPIGVITLGNGTLLLTPNLAYDSSIRVKVFFLKDYSDPEMLFRALIGAYIAGFTTIRVASAGRIPPKVRQVVRKFTQMTIGQEVAEESDNSIILKDILNPVEMPFETTIRRMYMIVKAMHEDALYALEQGRRELAEDVAARDVDVGRLYWLIHRQSSLVTANFALSAKMDVDTAKAMMYYQIARILERMGDHAVAISDAVIALIDLHVDHAAVAKVTAVGEASLDIFNRGMKAIYANSIPEANSVIEAANALQPEYHTLSATVPNTKIKEAVAITAVVNSLRRISEYSSDIAEILINQMVNSEEKSRAFG